MAGSSFIVPDSRTSTQGAINNAPTTPIFDDGSMLAANDNNFRASYEGGNGNDLTLAVVPQLRY